MTLLTNMPPERVIPPDAKVIISAFDITRGIPNDVPLGSDVQISWNGRPGWLIDDLNRRGIFTFPCHHKPASGDTIAVIMEPINRMLVLRLM